MKKTEKITVWDYTDAMHGGKTKVELDDIVEYNVDAWCVGGKEGIIAYFYVGNLICVAHGDDGHWWMVNRMSSGWLKELKYVINSIEG